MTEKECGCMQTSIHIGHKHRCTNTRMNSCNITVAIHHVVEEETKRGVREKLGDTMARG